MRPWDRSTSRAGAAVGPGIAIGRDPARLLLLLLPSPPADVTVARPSSFSFSRDFAFRRSRDRARECTYNACPYLNASHDIPLVRVLNGTMHNSRVSGGVWLSRYQGCAAIGHATLVKTDIPRTLLKKEAERSRGFSVTSPAARVSGETDKRRNDKRRDDNDKRTREVREKRDESIRKIGYCIRNIE